MQTVSRFYKDQRTILSPVQNSPTITWTPQLVFNAGYFSHNGYVYDLTQPGFYRFWNPMVNTTHMIVGGDVIGLLSGAAWLNAFGDDDAKAPSETQAQFISRVSTKARTSKVKLLCENTVDFARASILHQHPTRKVRYVTTDTPNNVVDGHVCVEVHDGTKWIMADLSLNTMFKDAQGNLLNANDAALAIQDDTFEYEPLSVDGYSVEFAGSYTYDATGYVETFLLTDADRRAWHRRIFNAVGIEDANGQTYFYIPAGYPDKSAWIESLSPNWHVMSEAAWLAKYYPS